MNAEVEHTSDLAAENAQLHARLQECEELVRAIREDDLDALVTEGRQGAQVRTLHGAEQTFRMLVERMTEGAAALTPDGRLIYANDQFTRLLHCSLNDVLGDRFKNFLLPADARRFRRLLLRARNHVARGAFTLCRPDGATLPVALSAGSLAYDDTCFISVLVTDLSAQHRASRVSRLLDLSTALAGAVTQDAAADVVAREVMNALGANGGVLSLLDESGAHFENIRLVGNPAEATGEFPGFDADAAMPIADAVRQRAPLVLESWEQRQARYPHLSQVQAEGGDGALVALPLLLGASAEGARPLGGLGLSFPEARTFSAEDLDFMQAVAQQCALALERARLFEAESRARARLEREVDERREAEAALRASEERMRLAIQANRLVAWAWDPIRDQITTSENFAEVYGLPALAGVAEGLSLVWPEDTPAHRANVARVAREGGEYHSEFCITRPVDGRTIWLEEHAAALTDAEGQVTRVVGIVADITQRKQREEALERALHDVRAFTDNAPGLIAYLDREERYQFVNATYEAWFGLPGNEIIGRTGAELIGPEPYAIARPRLHAALAGEVAIFEYELNTVHGPRHVLARFVPDRDAEGQVRGVYILAMDVTERREAEAALRDSEERFRLLVQHSAHIIWRAQPDGLLLGRQPSWERFTGQAFEDYRDNGGFDAIHPDDREAVRARWQGAVAAATAFQAEYRLRHHSGEYRHVLTRGIPLRTAEGSVREWMGYIEDITERKQIEATLRESEERYRSLVSLMPEAVLIRVDERLLYVNAAGARMFGAESPEALRARSLHDLLHPDEREVMERRMAQLRAGETPPTVELRLRRLAGADFIGEIAAAPIMYEGERAALVLLRDITERKRAEEALRLANYRFRTAEEAANGFSWLWDLATGKVTRSLAVERITGYARAELATTHQAWLDLMHPDDRRPFPTEAEALAYLRRVPEDKFGGEYRLRHKAGHEVWVLERGLIVRDEAGQPRLVVGQTVDITERKRAESALRESEARYRNLFTSIDQGFCILEMIYNETGRAVDYRFLEVNPTFEAHTGLKDAAGKTARELVPELEDYWIETYARVAETGQTTRFELGSAAMEGRLFDVEAARVGERHERKVALLFRDITERRRMEAQLRESEARFRTMADISPVMIWVTGAQGHLEFINRAYAEFFGITLEQLLGSGGWQPLVHPDDAPAYLGEFLRAMQQRRAFRAQTRVRAADGTWRWIDSFAAPRLSESGDFLGLVGSSPDITEMKQAEANLRQAREQAERAAREALQTARRIASLQALTAALSKTVTAAQMADVIVDESVPVLGAQAGIIALLRPATAELEIVRATGYPPEVVEAWRRFSLGSPTPAAEAARLRELVIVGSPEQAAAKYPPLSGAQSGLKVWAVAPLVFDDRVLGVIDWGFAETRTFSAAEQALMRTLAEQCAQALQRVYLFEAEHLARRNAERDRERTARLQALTSALSSSVGVGDVARVITRQSLMAFGATGALLSLVTPEGDQLELTHAEGYPQEIVHRLQRLPLNSPYPLAEVARTGVALWFESQADLAARHPELAEQRPPGLEALALKPLRLQNQVLGVLGLSFAEAHTFTVEERGYLLTIATQCAQALQRARLYEQEIAARAAADSAARRAEFLAAAANAITIARREDELLAGIARLMVTELADWCCINLLAPQHSELRLVAAAHHDPAREPVFYQLAERFPLNVQDRSGTAAVIRSRQPEWRSALSQTELAELFPEPGLQQAMLDLGFHSYLIVPLAARGQAFGALTLGASKREYGPEAVRLAEEIAQRLALGLENLSLFQAEQRAREVAEAERERTSALQSLTAALAEALTPEDVGQVALGQGLEAVHADAGWLGVISASGRQLELGRAVGYPAALLDAYFPVDLDALLPTTEAIRLRGPIFLENETALKQRYPHVSGSRRSRYMAATALPLILAERVLGTLNFSFADERIFTPEERSFLTAFAQQCAQALERARLFEAEQQARELAETERERTAALQSLTAALVEALTPEQVGQVVLGQGLEAVEASAGAIVLESPEGAALVNAHTVGYPDEAVQRFATMPLDMDTPLHSAYRHHAALFLEGLDDWHAAYPHMVDAHVDTGRHASIFAPLTVHSRTFGVLNFSFSTDRRFSPQDRAFVVAFSQQCAQALERARLFQAEQQSRLAAASAAREAAFLAELGKSLSTVLDPDQALLAVARHAVPDLADCAVVDVVRTAPATAGATESVLERRAVVGASPEAEAALRALPAGYPLPLNGDHDLAQALRTGQPRLIPLVPDELIAARTAADGHETEAHRALVRAVPARSWLIVPVFVRNAIYAVLTLGARAERAFSSADLTLAEEVTRRTATAVERALLYREAQAARAAADAAAMRAAFLAEASQALTRSLEYGTMLRDLAQFVVPRLADYCLVYGVAPDAANTLLGTAYAHVNPDKLPLVAGFVAYFQRVTLDAASPQGRALLDGQSQLDPDVGEKNYVGLPPDVQAIVRPLNSRSSLTVVMRVRGRMVGTLTLVTTDDSGRRYTPDDLALAEELARRAALAADNARLYAELQAWTEELELRVQQRTEELRASQAELQRFSGRLEQTREEERSRIAREVHDELGGSLTGVKMGLVRLRRHLEVNQPEAEVDLQALIDLVDTTVQTVRRIAAELRPAVLDDLGLLAALEWQTEQFHKLTGIVCRLDCELAELALDREASTAVFRVFQEALTYVARHSQATVVEATIERHGPKLVLRIHDNGRGLQAAELKKTTSLGLVGMRERMRRVSGDFTIRGEPGKGTTILIRVPYPGAPAMEPDEVLSEEE